jgi:UDP-glucose-4-epimerase GalE
MRVLVTGGAGYVGSHAAKLLAEHGHEVWIVDNLAEGHRAAAGMLPLVVADLIDQPTITKLLKSHRIDAVMHFAAFCYVGVSVREPAKYYQNNIVGTLALLEALRAADVRRIVFSSTCATYGNPIRVPIDEDHPQQPITPYGFTKLAIERALADYAHAYGLGYAALRYFNASGAAADGSIGEDHDPETHLIPLVLQVALGQREKVDIFGTDYPTPDGTCIRDYIHVDDLASAHVLALEKITDGAALKLNLGTGRGASVEEIVEHCREVTGHAIPARAVARREGDPPELVADASAAKRVLGWEAEHKDVRTVIESAWRWHAAHPHGYDD